MLTLKRYRVFCPRCGDSRTESEPTGGIYRLLDKPCRKCGELGVDAVET